MDRLKVNLGKRSYDIIIGSGILAQLPKHVPQKKAFIVTDENVAVIYLPKLEGILRQAGIEFKSKILPAGEPTKSFKHLEELCSWLLAEKIERKATIVALGGGVIGDLVGFAASIVLRGVDFIQVPTTLLAQVDSSVGGKTAINSRHGKNMIGSFYQPKLVLADTELLKTLPKREFLAGYAEIVKYGLINDAKFFAWLDANSLGDEKNLAKAIYHSCKAKAKIVAADEKEGGIRALLNLGHTFGHALEAETGFSDQLLHGEAVALGTVMAFRLSVKLGLCKASEAERVVSHFRKLGLPVDARQYVENWNVESLIKHMKADKKVKDGHMVFILAKGIGKAFIAENVPEKDLREFLKDYGRK